MQQQTREGGELEHFHAVVPAGGSGTRLWPLSRRSAPKFLLDLTGSGASMLQDTVHRLRASCGDRVLVVTGALHGETVRAQLPQVPARDVVIEPSPRESMPAIALASALLVRRDPDAVIGSFPADHVIGDDEAFTACVREAYAAAQEGALVTLGVRPTFPATGFGYIAVGHPAGITGAERARRALEFVEKPDRERAQRYLDGGAHLWNAGMFVVRASRLLELLEQLHPALADGVRAIAADPGRIDEVWPGLEAISIDRALAEPAAAAGQLLVLPADFGWDDVGDFAALAEVLQDGEDHPGLRILGARDQVLSRDSTGVIAAHGGRTVVTLGVPDVVVVDTADALLVTTRERVQDVKGVVAALRELGLEDLT